MVRLGSIDSMLTLGERCKMPFADIRTSIICINHGIRHWLHQRLANHDTFPLPKGEVLKSAYVSLASWHMQVTYPSPFLEHLLALFLTDIGFKNHSIFLINLF